MTTTNITNFRKNAFNYVEQTIKYNEPLSISTKDGDAVLLSALKQPLDECLDEEDVEW